MLFVRDECQEAGGVKCFESLQTFFHRIRSVVRDRVLFERRATTFRGRWSIASFTCTLQFAMHLLDKQIDDCARRIFGGMTDVVKPNVAVLFFDGMGKPHTKPLTRLVVVVRPNCSVNLAQGALCSSTILSTVLRLANS